MKVESLDCCCPASYARLTTCKIKILDAKAMDDGSQDVTKDGGFPRRMCRYSRYNSTATIKSMYIGRKTGYSSLTVLPVYKEYYLKSGTSVALLLIFYYNTKLLLQLQSVT